MCSSGDAEEKIRKAKILAKKNPGAARKEMLEAAEIYLMLSALQQHGKEQNLARAEELFSEANTLSLPRSPQKEMKKHGQGKGKNHLSGRFTPVTNPAFTFRDVGGLEELKEEIRFKIIEPLLHPEVYEHYGKSIGGGILMYGPPGCGKSLIAEATAGEAGATFFSVKPSQIKSKFVGEAEQAIAELFRLAREHQPSIVFFDEFESLGADRDETASNERGVITQLLTESDGLGTKGQQILLLAATNEPWAIDVALRREGRFGTTLFVPPPDREARREIFKIHLRGRPLSKEIDARRLLLSTDGFSGADIRALCERAADIPLREYFRSHSKRAIEMRDFLTALEQHSSIVRQWFDKAESELRKQRKTDAFPEVADWISSSLSAENAAISS